MSSRQVCSHDLRLLALSCLLSFLPAVAFAQEPTSEDAEEVAPEAPSEEGAPAEEPAEGAEEPAEDEGGEDQGADESVRIVTPVVDAPAEPAPAPEVADKEEKKDGVLAPPRLIPVEDEDLEQVSFNQIASTFTFGSYGRVGAASDLRGGQPGRVNVISHGSRLGESNYAELEFGQRFELPKSATDRYFTQIVATLAFGDDLFHFTGDFDQSMAFRNLYAEGGWRLNDLTISFWAGSRMYRGDDIYLLDFWPLDNLNTVGGGGLAAYDWKGWGRSEFKLHVGSSRLNNPYQFQVVDVPGFDFGTNEIVYLNRLRTILTGRFQQDIWLDTRPDGSPTAGIKAVLYGESHTLPEGLRRRPDGLSEELVPAESGRKLGAEIGYWMGDGFFKGSFANLFLVTARDLAAYGEFGVPTGVNLNETSEGARMQMLALSADLETPHAGLLVGSYYKYFQDADRESADFDDYWEATFAARTHIYLTDHIHPGIEYSYQVRRPQGPFIGTDEYEVPSVSKLSFIQAINLKKGMYSRPQLRFIYTWSQLNRSAVALFPTDDPRRDLADGTTGALNTHYLGAQVEWWFNNASLFRP